MSPKKKVGKKIGRFIMTRLSLFIITFLVVVSAITLAAYTTILNGETKPTTSGTLAVTRGQKVHDFVNSRTTDGLGGLMTTGSLVVKGILGVFDPIGTYTLRDRTDTRYKTRLYVQGNGNITDNLFVGNKTTTSKVFIYGGLQLSTITGLIAHSSCNTGAIGTIRMRVLNTTPGTTVCPLEICYPGHQSGATQDSLSRKKTCDPVSFNAAPIRTEYGIEDEQYSTL